MFTSAKVWAEKVGWPCNVILARMLHRPSMFCHLYKLTDNHNNPTALSAECQESQFDCPSKESYCSSTLSLATTGKKHCTAFNQL